MFLKRPYIFFNFLLLICLSITSNFSFANELKCSSIKYPAPSGAMNDIEFIFYKPYICGQFANGDWWVSDNNRDGVKIIAITPNEYDGFNGYEVNPDNKNKQAFDKRISGYTQEIIQPLPLILNGTGASIIKAVSVPLSTKKCRPCIQFAAVLTVTRQPVLLSSAVFRPGYFGASKNTIKLDKLIIDKLGMLSTQYIFKNKPSFESITDNYQGVRLDHLFGWTGRSMHPKDNMPDYGAAIATNNAVAVLRMLLDDFNIDNKIHKKALVNYLQMAIDLRSMVQGGVTWTANGGHGNGRKLPLLFAAEILNDPAFVRAVQKSIFSEDQQVYLSKVTGRALYGRDCNDAQYWQRDRFAKGKRDCADPYGFIDGGGKEIGEAYQKCCTAKPWKYTALAIHLIGLQTNWKNDAFLQYVDRWVNHGVWSKPDPCAGFNDNPSDYKKKYGPSKELNCISGNGRYINKHGMNKNTGYYSNKFAEQMWDFFRK